MSGGDAPIGRDEAKALFSGLDRPLAIAVSGGVDSITLMHLVADWRAAGGGIAHPAPLILTVDHGLRPESADEARFVAASAQRVGLPHETLPWLGTKPSTGLQDAARQARYDLLFDRLARDPVPRDLLLAHHQEDQAETLLMRLARGSGLDGLAAMRALDRRIVLRIGAKVEEVALRLRRPLLGVPKGRLVATATAAGLAWRDDPSNQDVRFERVRLRRAQLVLSNLGLTPAALVRSALRLGEERDAAQARLRMLGERHVDDHGGAFGTLLLPPPPGCAPSDLVRLLARMLAVFGGAAPSARLSQVETLAAELGNRQQLPGLRRTLGGCIVEGADDHEGRRKITIVREAGRQPLPSLVLQPGAAAVWDGRFDIEVAATAPTAVRIGPCLTTAPDDLPAGLPRAMMAGLPAVETAEGCRLLWGRTLPHVNCRWPDRHRAALRWQPEASEAPETI